MLTLILPPRLTPDSVAIGEAALATCWRVERLPNWRPSDRLRDGDLVLYGEPLFADVVSGPLGLALIEPTADWLTHVAQEYLLRSVRFARGGATADRAGLRRAGAR
jgi:hypothetical protein